METEKREDIYILFCENPVDIHKVDPDFEDEQIAARQNGFETFLFSYDNLISKDRSLFATHRIPSQDKLAKIIYRGWMLTPAQYNLLYQQLLNKNLQLVNNAEEYRNCHYLPDSLQFIADRTPKSIYEKGAGQESIDRLVKKAKIFGNHPVILKDYVKSEKHDWETACFVKDASDTNNLKQTISNLIKLRGEWFNEGIVIREFIELKELTLHSKSGMPLTEEYRLFFYNNELVDIFDYWEEGDYNNIKPETAEFEKLAKRVKSQFFSMDIARMKNGEFIIIELGDGQVAGLPDKTDRNDFYKQLKHLLKSQNSLHET